MKVLFVKGTSWSGKMVGEGEVHDMPEHEFRGFKLRGQAVEVKPEPKPEPEPPAAPTPEPTKASAKRKKRKAY